MSERLYEKWFLGDSNQSLEQYYDFMNQAAETLETYFATGKSSFSGNTPSQVRAQLMTNFIDMGPEKGQNTETLFKHIGESILQNAVHVHHPACVAHLQCPPLIPAMAAEVLIAGMNQSLDSWDQSGAATIVEQEVVSWLCDLYQLPNGDGVFTTGGTQSNYMGLLLAREHISERLWNWNPRQKGMHPESHRLRILCSEEAHFTVQQSAAFLGLGEQSVVSISTDENYRLSITELEQKLDGLFQKDMLPFALFATAGTTDFGSIDPLPQMAELAHEYGLWFHVDAAYGGAVQLSEMYKGKIDGIQEADSITIDFHKQFYQPISSGVFLLKDQKNFQHLKLNADYLNPEEDEAEGIPNLVGKSVQTTRRFDALKLFLSLQSLGVNRLGSMVDTTIDLARQVAQLLVEDPYIQIEHEPELNAIVFRFSHAQVDDKGIDEINMKIHDELLRTGKAVIARTKVNGKAYLKLTLLNPNTTIDDIETLLQELKCIAFNLLEQQEGLLV
ncbi:L-2,4-diaminobutyrate decarboxylase [Lentibacillus persicus]|uniref:L-2,4-diaminobutyrate decarboxylase n=1 Tax=Lentibacillus persicus TaxID=640948 RepID=A0A1I2AY29_9BACI|nr:aspartate aminotransferase family protein [Lentibacillus persicus]SFE47800.1 L-2,4-diaminobutyrate decarboxylase [Lentibacillus persicus]